jgi:hypothetical protein
MCSVADLKTGNRWGRAACELGQRELVPIQQLPRRSEKLSGYFFSHRNEGRTWSLSLSMSEITDIREDKKYQLQLRKNKTDIGKYNIRARPCFTKSSWRVFENCESSNSMGWDDSSQTKADVKFDHSMRSPRTGTEWSLTLMHTKTNPYRAAEREKLAQRLEELANDLRHLDDPDFAATIPSLVTLSNWSYSSRPVLSLQGIAHEHPLLGSKPIHTSQIFHIDYERGLVRTLSRWYRLGPRERNLGSDDEH